MSSIEIFLHHAPPALRAALQSFPALDEVIERLVSDGRTSWPQLVVGDALYAQFLGRHMLADVTDPGVMQQLRTRDLYLVCAYGHGIPGAHEILESRYMPKARQALGRLGTSAATIDDILQRLRQSLLEMSAPNSTRRGYSGRGDLEGWLFLCAVREGLKAIKRAAREPLLEEATAEILPSGGMDPETELLIRRYKAPFQRAFEEAIAKLTSRDRNLLRSHFLGRLSIDQIAHFYQVHRATAARWIIRAQERLAEQTRILFLSRVQMNDQSMGRIVAAIRSQLSLNLSKILDHAVEPELVD